MGNRYLAATAVVVGVLCLVSPMAHAQEEAATPSEHALAPVTLPPAEDGGYARLAPCAPCPPCPPCKRWLIRAEAGMGGVEPPDGLLGDGLPPNLQGFDWGEIKCSGALAARLTLGYRIAPCDLIELRGTWWGTRSGEDRQTGHFGFQNQNGVSPRATATLENESTLWSAELGWWHRIADCGCWEWRGGLGFRYLRFDEMATARDWVGLAPTSFLQSDVENSLYAGQLMGAWAYAPGRWAFTLSGRLFLGSMNRKVRIDEDSILSGGVKAGEAEATEFGWGVEAGFDILFRLNRCLALTAGYSFLYASEVTRANDAMDFTQAITGAVQPSTRAGSVYAHAIMLGIQVDL